MTVNLVIQWVSIGIIFLILAVILVRKIVRAVRGGHRSPGCSCGSGSCSSCPGCRDTDSIKHTNSVSDDQKSTTTD